MNETACNRAINSLNFFYFPNVLKNIYEIELKKKNWEKVQTNV